MSLTKEQLLVKNTRNKNMLVSAAAGSGKTFVLVERIISEILEDEKGINVDEILVVTFTTAAANEMKDRIRKAIDKAILQKGADPRIRSQATLIHNAHIRTIDSFCNWVVKNYFYEIDMDPSFRVGQTGELKMLKDNVFNELLSSKLEEADEEFKLLADAYITGRRTDKLKNIVFELHDKATSYAWIDEWYDNATKLYDIKTVDELAASEVISDILKLSDVYLGGIVRELRNFVNIYPEDSSSSDKEIFSKELLQLETVLSTNTFDDKFSAIRGCDFSTKFSKKGTCLGDDEIEYGKDIRKRYKAIVKELTEKYFSTDLNGILEDALFVKRQARALIEFTREYTKELLDEKKRKNIFDFNDIEHMALEILRDKTSKEHEKRAVAIELSNHFKEIMVDEYQDSNELQEQILTAICNGHNYFTVGDVKQSIYAFRQASPRLFIDKLYSYPMTEDGDSIRIDLDKNFRSRWEVLDFCNKVFEPLMQMDVGGVLYDDKAALKLGDETFKGDNADFEAEALVAVEKSDSMKEMEIDDSDTLEALVIAKRIKELLESNYSVSEKGNTGRQLRPMCLSDVVILMRGVKGHAEKYIATLKSCGIPAYVADETGFFERDEVQTVMAMLKTIDNPFNDIPLAAVLHSPMFGFTSERLAEIRAYNPKTSLFECVKEYNEQFNSKDLQDFFLLLDKFRDQAIDTPIHEVLRQVLKDTGFDIYTKSLPGGRMAYANLEKLIDEAVKFESTSFKGLSRFVSYIEGLKTYNEDLGLAKTTSEKDDAVRILTIHKSKGLEFPVVFLAGCGKPIQHDSGSVLYDDKLGMALKYCNPSTRIIYETPLYNAVKMRLEMDSRGEFLRILYVALTRAVDKLIITASIKPNESKSVAEKLAEYSDVRRRLDTYTKLKASSSLELILRGLAASGADFHCRIIDCQDLFIDEVEKSLVREQVKNAVNKFLANDSISPENPVKNMLDFQYDGLKDSAYKSKYSVSEIKHQAMEEAFSFNADAVPLFLNKEEESYVPLFMRNGEKTSDSGHVFAGALYGTAMHRFLECFDFAREDFVPSFEEQLSYMKKIHCLSEDEFSRLSPEKLKKFLHDESAVRMSKAAIAGKLYKEKPFVFGSAVGELFNDSKAGNEMVLVQGIIDVFWEENDGLVLLDYKTDRVDEANELVLRYQRQLQLYKSAIEKAYEQPVKEVLIYSFALERSISICMTN